jgi:phage regulator Rha-like protein
MRKLSIAPVPRDRIIRSIVIVRGQKVILDADVASLYGVETRTLVQAVKRNIDRFPADFMFAVTAAEMRILKSQSVISRSWGGRRSTPFAFTEHGVAMLSSVLRGERATRVNIEIMRAFVGLREALATHAALVRKLEALEQKFDGQFRVVFDAIRGLMSPRKRSRKPIGFVTAKKK